MGSQPAATRFLAAFNEIEDHLRRALGADAHVDFGQLTRVFAARRHLLRAQVDALSAFAALRNAISHGRYYDGRPIAEPVPEVVAQIERLRDQITSPPVALTVLRSMEVCSVSPGDPIVRALEYVGRFDYSQLPVYDQGAYVGLLTTNAIARWLAAQLADNGGLAESERIGDVMRFAEPHEKGLLVPRAVTVTDAVHRLTRGGVNGQPVTALIVTADGQAHQKPLAVIVNDDLPALSAALALS
jgi:predicted transcriptional regulator